MICDNIDTIIGIKMNNISLNTIMHSEQDSELITYKILGTFKEYLINIRKFRIYPTLSELVNLAMRLESLKKSFIKTEISDDDLFILDEEHTIFDDNHSFEDNSEDPENIEESSALINWIISQINPILDEGIALYEFVHQNMEVKLINGDPLFKELGYLIIPDNLTSVYNIYNFNCSVLKTESFPEKTIKTKFLQSIPIINPGNISSQYSTLLHIFGKNNFPVYICETELDFPYEETIFQVARKKLLGTLSA
jgi:hypothetical protein